MADTAINKPEPQPSEEDVRRVRAILEELLANPTDEQKKFFAGVQSYNGYVPVWTLLTLPVITELK